MYTFSRTPYIYAQSYFLSLLLVFAQKYNSVYFGLASRHCLRQRAISFGGKHSFVWLKKYIWFHLSVCFTYLKLSERKMGELFATIIYKEIIFIDYQYHSQRIHFAVTLLSCGSSLSEYQKWKGRHPKLEMDRHYHKAIKLESHKSSCLKIPFTSKQMREIPDMEWVAKS